MEVRNTIPVFWLVILISARAHGKTFYYSGVSGYQNYMEKNGITMCDGEENLKSDIEILSFLLSGISSVAGLFALTEFSVPSNNITIINTILGLILWVPSAVLTFLATSDPFSYITGNLVNLGSLFVTLYGGLGIFPGTADIIVSTMDEMLGISALILSALTTFPDMYDELKQVFQQALGKETVNEWIRGYGCGGFGGNLGLLRDMINGR